MNRKAYKKEGILSNEKGFLSLVWQGEVLIPNNMATELEPLYLSYSLYKKEL